MHLDKGAMLFAPKVDNTLKTPFGVVKVDAGSLVLVLSFAHGLAVYDLDDMHHSAVCVSTTNGQQFELYPGMNVVLTSSAVREFEQINPAQLFSYRNIKRHEIGGGFSAFSTEFSVQAAIQAVPQLKQLVNSKHPTPEACLRTC